MRTSKNVQACPGGGRIFYHSALLCRQLESISLSLTPLMDMMQISCWSKKDKIEGGKKKEVEESAAMSRAAGKVKT